MALKVLPALALLYVLSQCRCECDLSDNNSDQFQPYSSLLNCQTWHARGAYIINVRSMLQRNATQCHTLKLATVSFMYEYKHEQHVRFSSDSSLYTRLVCPMALCTFTRCVRLPAGNFIPQTPHTDTNTDASIALVVASSLLHCMRRSHHITSNLIRTHHTCTLHPKPPPIPFHPSMHPCIHPSIHPSSTYTDGDLWSKIMFHI